MLTSPKNHTIYSQGAAADAVFYIQTGMVKLTVVSPEGKEAIVATLEAGAFVGGILPRRTRESPRTGYHQRGGGHDPAGFPR